MPKVQFHIDLSDMPAGRRYAVSYDGAFHAVTPHTAQTRAALAEAEPAWAAKVDRLSHFTAPIERSRKATSMPRAVAGFFDDQTGAWTIRRVAQVSHPLTEPRADLTRVEVSCATTLWTFACHHPDLLILGNAGSRSKHTDQEAGTSRPPTHLLTDLLNNSPVSNALSNLVVAFQGLTEKQQWIDSKPVAYGDQAKGDSVVVSTPNIWGTSPGGEGSDSDTALAAVASAATALVQTAILVAKNMPAFDGILYHVTTGQATAPVSPPPPSVFAVARDELDAAGPLTTIVSPVGSVSGVTITPTASVSQGNTTLSVQFSNTLVRWLGLDICPINPDGSVGNSLWPLDTPPLCPPCDTTLGFADPGNPGTQTVSDITLPGDAIGWTVYADSLGAAGTFTNTTAFSYGAAMTAFFNLIVPAIFLAAAVEELGEDEIEISSETYFKSLLEFLDDQSSSILSGEFSFSLDTVTSLAEAFAVEIFDSSIPAIAEVGAWMSVEITSEELVHAVPFVGWTMAALSALADLAALGETIAEIVTAQQEVTTTISFTGNLTLDVTVSGTMPALPEGATWTLEVTGVLEGPSTGTNANSQFQQWTFTDVTFTDNAASVTLDNLAANGATLAFRVALQPSSDSLSSWSAATGMSSPVSLLPSVLENTTAIAVTLADQPVPITNGTTYSFATRLYNDNDAFSWGGKTPYGGLANNLNSGAATGDIGAMLGLDYAGASGSPFLCAAWQGAAPNLSDQNGQTLPSQMTLFALVSAPGAASFTLDQSPVGLNIPGSAIVGRGTEGVALPAYVVDATPLAAPVADQPGYHVRQLGALASDAVFSALPSPSTPWPASWGCLAPTTSEQANQTGMLSDAALHPSGHIIAINRTSGYLWVLPAPAGSTTQADAAVGRMAGGVATNASKVQRIGLLAQPAAVAVTSDGVILTLELGAAANQALGNSAGTPRLQAFAISGAPVRLFTVQGKEGLSATLDLPTGSSYFDIAVTGSGRSGFVFLSSCAGALDNSSNYSIAVYPFGTASAADSTTAILSTPIPAARIAVDSLHNLYSLDFGPVCIGDDTGTPTVMPSITQWAAVPPPA